MSPTVQSLEFSHKQRFIFLSPEHVLGTSPASCSLTGNFTNADVSEMQLIRWGLIDPCTRNWNAISCVFSGYHAVRRHFKTSNQFFLYNQTELSSAQLCCARAVFADAFKLEARERCIYTRTFLLPSFLEFISASDASAGTRRSTRLRSDAQPTQWPRTAARRRYIYMYM